MNRIYLAGSYSRKEEIDRYSQELFNMGYYIASSWHSGEAFDDKTAAKIDLLDIGYCDTMIVFVNEYVFPQRTKWTISMGHAFEAGYAYHAGKKLIIIGTPVTIFYRLDGIKHYENFEAFKTALESRKSTVAS